MCSRLPNTWNEANIDFTLLSLTIVLLSTTPEHQANNGGESIGFMSLYLSTKACSALVEGIGINSLLVVQSRLLIALFEAAHGFYPAAYVSIGATVRAAEALVVYGERDVPMIQSTAGDRENDELMITWRGVLIVDR